LREISAEKITAAVAALCARAAVNLPPDTLACFKKCKAAEASPAKKIFEIYEANAQAAACKKIPLCQDTGTAVIFLEIGRGVRVDGDIYAAINKGVKEGYTKNYLRVSIVDDPVFERKNTGDNTPAVIHTKIVKRDKIKIILLPKGGGAENMSRLKMLTPADGVQGVKDFVLETVKLADANPCPPVVVGVGIGGGFDGCAELAKRALIRPLGKKNKNKNYAALEAELLKLVNKLGIGPQGFGGRTTALAVHIEYAPCHMASMPVAVNIGCHSHRRAEAVL
jgi:fumarate hydratase subunit alpha